MYAPNMKIYNGYIITKAGREWTVVGRQKIRKTQWLLVKSGDDTRSMNRSDVIDGLNRGVITITGGYRETV